MEANDQNQDGRGRGVGGCTPSGWVKVAMPYNKGSDLNGAVSGVRCREDVESCGIIRNLSANLRADEAVFRGWRTGGGQLSPGWKKGHCMIWQSGWKSSGAFRGFFLGRNLSTPDICPSGWRSFNLDIRCALTPDFHSWSDRGCCCPVRICFTQQCLFGRGMGYAWLSPCHVQDLGHWVSACGILAREAMPLEHMRSIPSAALT